MPGELFGLFVLTGGTVAAVLAYLVWSHVSAAWEKAREAEKEQRWRVAFGMAEESPPAPKPGKPGRAWLPVAVLVGALAIGAGLMVADDGEEGGRPAAADNLAARFPGPWREDYLQLDQHTVEQRRELALFSMRALGAGVNLAAVTAAPDEAETRELVATGINLNGLLCARVTAIRPLEVDGNYEVECLEYRGGKITKSYFIDVWRGLALIPGAEPGSSDGWIRP